MLTYQCRGRTLITLKGLYILLEGQKSKCSVGNEAIISLDNIVRANKFTWNAEVVLDTIYSSKMP